LSVRGFRSGIYTSTALDSGVVDEIGGTPVSRYSYFYPEWPLSSERKLLFDNKGGNTVSAPLARALREADGLSLIHCHTGNLLGAQCLKVAQGRGIPLVVTLHGGHFAIPAAEMENLSHKGPVAPRRGMPLGRFLSLALGARGLLQNADAVICVGVEEYEAAKRALPRQRVEFLPGGVNLAEFDRADRTIGRDLLGADPDRPLVVCVARVDKQKDQATLVRAWRDHCAAEFDLALVGPETSPGYLDELKSLGQGAKGTLLLPGGVAPEQVPHVYAGADVSVLPSRHEPFGLTVLESWAAGTALVCSDVGGPAWLLRGEECGRLFPQGDAAALGAILDELLGSPDSRTEMVSAAKTRVQAEFSWDKRAERLGALYKGLLRSRVSA
jgi:glycosyltransferase involved in cell wall biosynthesis